MEYGPPRGLSPARRGAARLPDAGLAAYRGSRARWPGAQFDYEHHEAISGMICDICNRRAWRLHASMVTLNHLHIVASWAGVTLKPPTVQATFKRLLGLTMARRTAIRGRQWFSEGGKPQRVEDIKHLRHLKYEYLPGHLGTLWLEDYLA